jgi:peptidyl-prolyl cis-trans isomerase B (cyclophilin B)
MKKALLVLFIFLLTLSLLAGCSKPEQKPPEGQQPVTREKTDPNNPVAIIEMEAGGTIEVELYREAAPNTVRHFIHLANQGYYNGLAFDYIMSDFLIIGGNSPEGDPGYSIAGEFAANGFNNNVPLERGTIALYHGGHPDSGRSQFFILADEAPHLEGNYAAFGKVLKGFEVVDRISNGPSTEDGWAQAPLEIMKKVTVDTMGQTYGEPEKVEEWDASQPNPVVTLEIEAGGTIKIELMPAVALNTVRNFVALVEQGFYDGLKFHRIIPGFMLQGGDPQGNGTGGPGHRIHGEFAANGILNTLSHQRGVISMARSQPKDSAGSQFFIVVGDASFLDGQYAGFGRVIEGMDIADRIVNGPSDQAQNGLALAPFEVIKKASVDTFGVDIGAPKVIKP